MKKLLLAIYLTLMVSTLNGETVKNENINWVKLTDDSEKDKEIVKNTKEGTAYVDIKGKRLICGEIKKGKEEGKWIYWYENGQKMLEGDYIDGKEEGKWRSWDITGYKYTEITYKDGECIDWIYLKKNGERKDILTTTKTGVKIIRLPDKNVLDKNIQQDDIFVMYLLLLGIIQNTKKGIVYQEIKGKDYKCGEIKNGKFEGKWIEHYENGKKESEGYYKNGKKDGKWIYFDEKGKKHSEVIYEEDQEEKTIEYDENGNIKKEKN